MNGDGGKQGESGWRVGTDSEMLSPVGHDAVCTWPSVNNPGSFRLPRQAPMALETLAAGTGPHYALLAYLQSRLQKGETPDATSIFHPCHSNIIFWIMASIAKKS